jgi:hypothetical protein
MIMVIVSRTVKFAAKDAVLKNYKGKGGHEEIE